MARDIRQAASTDIPVLRDVIEAGECLQRLA
jgi:hypothetical protein